jgi:hypothetical protein
MHTVQREVADSNLTAGRRASASTSTAQDPDPTTWRSGVAPVDGASPVVAKRTDGHVVRPVVQQHLRGREGPSP